MRFNVNDVLSLIDGLNSYQVMQRDGEYLKLLCIDFEQVEQITYDLTVYNHNTEFWINRNDLHLFELIS
mgnify:CR=1 FL=1